MVPLFVCQILFAETAGQVPVPVTIPFAVVTQAAVPTVCPAAPLILKLLLPPTTRLISPVDPEPRVNVWALVVPKIPVPVKTVALLPELAEMEAVGVPPALLRKPNLAEAVEMPPTRRSRVEMFG